MWTPTKSSKAYLWASSPLPMAIDCVAEGRGIGRKWGRGGGGRRNAGRNAEEETEAEAEVGQYRQRQGHEHGHINRHGHGQKGVYGFMARKGLHAPRALTWRGHAFSLAPCPTAAPGPAVETRLQQARRQQSRQQCGANEVSKSTLVVRAVAQVSLGRLALLLTWLLLFALATLASSRGRA